MCDEFFNHTTTRPAAVSSEAWESTGHVQQYGMKRADLITESGFDRSIK